MLKRVAKLFISLLFFVACSIIAVIRRMSGHSTRNVVVLYYHGIPSDRRANFARQLDMLRRWATPIEADLNSVPADAARCAAVTFDDGLRSFADTALPELEQRNIPAALFVVAGKLGCYPDWSERVRAQTRNREPLLTAEELRNLPESVTIGSHTLTHPVLTQVTAAQAMHELSESRLHLAKILGRDVTFFSFPHGAFDDELIESARSAGYTRVFTILPELAAPGDFAIGRVGVDPSDWRVEFLLKLVGAYRWLVPASTLKQKLHGGFVRVPKIVDLIFQFLQ